MALFWHTVKRNIAISTRDFECCNLNEKLQKWSWASKLPFFVVRKQSLLSRGPSLKGWSNQHKRKCVRQSKNSSPVERSLYQGIQVTQCTAQGVSKNLTGTLALQRVHWAQETVKCGTGLLFIICKKRFVPLFWKTISMTWALGSVLPFAMFWLLFFPLPLWGYQVCKYEKIRHDTLQDQVCISVRECKQNSDASQNPLNMFRDSWNWPLNYNLF